MIDKRLAYRRTLFYWNPKTNDDSTNIQLQIAVVKSLARSRLDAASLCWLNFRLELTDRQCIIYGNPNVSRCVNFMSLIVSEVHSRVSAEWVWYKILFQNQSQEFHLILRLDSNDVDSAWPSAYVDGSLGRWEALLGPNDASEAVNDHNAMNIVVR